MNDPPKKSQLSEERLLALAEARKKAMESNRKKWAAAKEKREQVKKAVVEKAEKQCEEMLQKRTINIDEPTQDVAPPSQESHVPKEPDYRQLYYKAKLERLSQAEQQQQAIHKYANAPPQVHAYDIAKERLAKAANDEVYKYAYRSIFPTG